MWVINDGCDVMKTILHTAAALAMLLTFTASAGACSPEIHCLIKYKDTKNLKKVCEKFKDQDATKIYIQLDEANENIDEVVAACKKFGIQVPIDDSYSVRHFKGE